MLISMDTLNDHDTTPDEGEPRSDPHGGAAATWSGPAAELLALGETLAAHPGRLPDGVTGDGLVRALAGLRPAQERVEQAALAALGAARALDVTWPRIGAALGLTPGGARDLYARLRRRHTDYREPVAPTLSAHTARAADLLAPVLDASPVSPFLAATATDRLGAVLVTAEWEAHDLAVVARWLSDDALSAPHQALNHHYGPDAGAARGVLNAHALDPAPVRAAVVELMRRAVSAPEPGAPLDAAPAARPLPSTGTDHRGGAEVAAAVASAGWPADWAAPVAELVDAVRLVALHLPADRARPLRALVDAVDAADGPALARAVGVLRDLDAGVCAELLGAEGQRALDALPVVLPGMRPVPQEVLGAHGPALAELVAAAGLPDGVAEPLGRLHRAAAPHLARRTGANRFPALDRLADLDRALRESDAHALAAAVHALPTTGVDLFDASSLAGVGDPLGGVLLALDDHAPARDGAPAEPAPAAAPPGADWDDLAAAVLPSTPVLAAAVARLLTAAAPHLDTGALARGKAHDALDALRRAVVWGRAGTIGTRLESVLKLKPTHKPLSALPEVADALRDLIHVYDQQ